MVVLRGLERSAVSHNLCPISAVFPSCPTMLWGELEYIFSYLTLRELCDGLGASCRAGCLAYEREINSRKGADRSIARFCHRSEWNTTLGDGMGLLVSYPRSGNTLMRSLLEAKTGRVTGSDSRPNRKLAAELLRCGFTGEGVCDNSVWVVKSHYPERMGCRRFLARRCVLLVRNPFDSILSYFHMGLTNTHHRALSSASLALPQLRKLWLDFAVAEAGVWKRFHDFWIQMARQVPVLVLRFEDVVSDPASTTAEAVRFLTENVTRDFQSKKRSGNLEKLKPVVAAPTSAMPPLGETRTPGYRHQVNAKKLGTALGELPPATTVAMLQVLGSTLRALGYSLQCPDNFGAVNDVSPDSKAATVLVHPLPVDSFLHLCSTEAAKQILVNDARMHEYSVRLENDRYGRGITDIRYSLTANDTEPFEVELR